MCFADLRQKQQQELIERQSMTVTSRINDVGSFENGINSGDRLVSNMNNNDQELLFRNNTQQVKSRHLIGVKKIDKKSLQTAALN